VQKTVWVYINIDALPGDPDYQQVFASEKAANGLSTTTRKALLSDVGFRSGNIAAIQTPAVRWSCPGRLPAFLCQQSC
jgi:hypothetical protein